ncbi:MAG: energy transducer TonB [Synergistaceae bacterium]|jgi:protein TonB|nr:energy transducer TonB [Synergistaceae bacterium]
MNRARVSFFLSLLLHTALIMTLASVTGKDTPAPREIMRVSLEGVRGAEGLRRDGEAGGGAAVAEDLEARESAEKIIPESVPVEIAKPEPARSQPAKPAKEPPKTLEAQKTQKTAQKTPEQQNQPPTPAKPAEKPARTANAADWKPSPALEGGNGEREGAAAGIGTASSEGTGDTSPGSAPSSRAGPDSGTPSGGSPRATHGIVEAGELKIMKRVTPNYPMISRKRKEQGTVILLIDIESGSVTSVRVERGSGHLPLDEAAIRAVKGWKFDLSGLGERITARIPFRFELK